MAKLFTFGGGALGELGTGRADDMRRPSAAPVHFPDETTGFDIEDFALGVNHSVAVVAGHVYWWGLWGAHADPEAWRNAGSRGSAPIKPEVVPVPTAISDLPLCSSGNLDETSIIPDGHVRRVVCGGSNTFMMTDDGEVFIIGNLRPPGGNPNGVRHLWGSTLHPASRVTSIAAGWRHCLLLTEIGQVFALGDDEHGQCAGVNSGDAPVEVPTQDGIAGVAAGACHSIAWDSTGSAFAWGHGGSGRLGLCQTQHQRKPLRVGKLFDSICLASCGANFTMFLSASREALWACGGNQYGQLGLGRDQSAREVPTSIGFPCNGEKVVSVACGANHVLCLTSTSSSQDRLQQRKVVWAWGCTSSGQLGQARAEEPCTSQGQAWCGVPRPVADFLSPRPDWALSVAAGRAHSAVLAAPESIACVSSPSQKKSVRKMRKAKAEAIMESEQQADDIIDMFCAGLGNLISQPSPRGLVSAHSSPRAEQSDLNAKDPSNASYTSPKKHPQRIVATTVHRLATPRTRVAVANVRQSSPRITTGQSQTAAPPGRVRRSIHAKNSPSYSPKKETMIKNDQGVESMKEPVVLGSVEDQWSGMRQSLAGLGSLIASIGATTSPATKDVLHQPVLHTSGSQQSEAHLQTVFAGDSAAGGVSDRRLPVKSKDHGNGSSGTAGSIPHLHLQNLEREKNSPGRHASSHSPMQPTAYIQEDAADDNSSEVSLDFSMGSDDSNPMRPGDLLRKQVRGPAKAPSSQVKPHMQTERLHQSTPMRYSSESPRKSLSPMGRRHSSPPVIEATSPDHQEAFHGTASLVSTPGGAFDETQPPASPTPLMAQEHIDGAPPEGLASEGASAADASLEPQEAPPRRRSSAFITVSRGASDVTSGNVPIDAGTSVSSTAEVAHKHDFIATQQSVAESSPESTIPSAAESPEEEQVHGDVPLEESYVDLDISRNDPSLVGLHGFAATQSRLELSTDLAGHGEGESNLPPAASEDDESQQDVRKILDDITESSSVTEDSERDEALLADLGFTDGNEDDGDDWV